MNALLAALLGAIALLGAAAYALHEAKQDGIQECRRDAQIAMAENLQANTAALAALAGEASRMSARVATARAAADDAGERLRVALAGRGVIVRAAAAIASAPATDPTGMCADVLGGLEPAARLYARTADERGTAGTACERSYDAVTEPVK